MQRLFLIFSARFSNSNEAFNFHILCMLCGWRLKKSYAVNYFE